MGLIKSRKGSLMQVFYGGDINESWSFTTFSEKSKRDRKHVHDKINNFVYFSNIFAIII